MKGSRSMTKNDQVGTWTPAQDRKDPLTVKCPNCQSKPGEKCTQPTVAGRQYIRRIHLARIDLVEGWL